jgi:hypothetical protein
MAVLGAQLRGRLLVLLEGCELPGPQRCASFRTAGAADLIAERLVDEGSGE